MMFLPLVLTGIAGITAMFVIADMKKDKIMSDYRKEVARMEWEQTVSNEYETEVYDFDMYKKCS